MLSTRVQRKTFQQTDLGKVVLCFRLEMRVSLLAVYSDLIVLNCHLEILTGLESEMGKGQSAL